MVQVTTGQGEIPAERIEHALEKAIDAFWAEFVDQFPEVKTGDMGPGDNDWLEEGAIKSAKIWLMWNHPHGIPCYCPPDGNGPYGGQDPDCPRHSHQLPVGR